MCMRWLLPPCNPENKEKNMQDFIPVIGFIGAYLVARMLGHGDIAMYVATAVLMIVTVLQIAWMLARKQTVEKRHWLTLAVILVLGAVTLVLRNDMFIKFKPTVLNFAIAAVFLGSQWVGKENLTQRMLGKVFDMPPNLWTKLNAAWVLFFAFSGLINAIVAVRASNDFYIGFKLWGLMGMTFAFMIAQFVVLRRYVRQEDKGGTHGQ